MRRRHAQKGKRGPSIEESLTADAPKERPEVEETLTTEASIQALDSENSAGPSNEELGKTQIMNG